MSGLLWLVVIILIFWMNSEVGYLKKQIKFLKGKVEQLEGFLQRGETLPVPETKPAQVVTQQDIAVTTPVAVQADIQPEAYKPEITWEDKTVYTPKKKEPSAGDLYIQSFLSWMKIDWPMKVGSLIFFIGVLWFMSYAIVNNWISPSARIAIGILLGIGFAVLGYVRHKAYPDQGSLLIGMGAGIYMLSIFIGFKFFGFFGAGNIGIIMILLQYFIVGRIAYRFKNKTLLMLSFFFAAIGPFLVNSGSHNYMGMMIYLIILTTAQIICSLATGRKSIKILPIIFYIIYFLSIYFSAQSGDADIVDTLGTVSFSFINILFYLIFLGAEFYEVFKKKYDITNIVYIAIVAMGLIGYSMFVSTIGLSILGVSCLVFFVLWYILSHYKDDKLNNLLTTIYVGCAGGMLYLQYSGHDLAIGLTLLCTISSVANLFISKSVPEQRYSLVFWLLPIANILHIYLTSLGNNGTIGQDYTYLLFLGLCLFNLGILTKYILDKDEADEVVFIEKLGGVIALTLYILGSFEGHLMIGILEFFGLFIIIVSNYIQKPSFKYVFRNATMITPFLALLGLGSPWVGGNYNDMMNFILFEGIFAILLVSQYLELSHHVENEKKRDYTSVLVYGAIWLFSLYFGFQYVIPTEYLAVAYLIISTVLYKISLHYKQYKISESAQYLFFVPIAGSLFNVWDTNITSNLVCYIAFATFALLLRGLFTKQKRYIKDADYIFYGLFILYSFLFLRQGSHHIIENNSATIISLIIFTLIGIGFYTTGKWNVDKQQTYIGSIIVLGVIIRIFMVELWDMTLIGRIVTCVIIGGLLIGSGYLGNRSKVVEEKKEQPPITA